MQRNTTMHFIKNRHNGIHEIHWSTIQRVILSSLKESTVWSLYIFYGTSRQLLTSCWSSLFILDWRSCFLLRGLSWLQPQFCCSRAFEMLGLTHAKHVLCQNAKGFPVVPLKKAKGFYLMKYWVRIQRIPCVAEVGLTNGLTFGELFSIMAAVGSIFRLIRT